VQTELIRLLEQPREDLKPIVDRADACLILVRYLDQATMHLIKDVYQLVHNETFLPKDIAILREHKEAEFKISCSYCGQKLWVRDRDAGRRGNCPKCRKTFFIPTQKAYLTSYLMLAENETIHSVVAGEQAPCRGIMEELVSRVAGMEEGAKSSTMRIELPPDEFSI
jgi:DNA-directed RNA polymerase subunit RPC12/RpoP